MIIVDTAAELAQILAPARRVAFVPTMGNLHAGHFALVDLARSRADKVVASIFVNPTQFGPGEDLARYPRDLEGDLEKCRAAKVDTVFAPEAGAMYPPGHRTFVEVTGLQDGLCGARRPGHFRGVATVVTQLFALARPHVAVFGEKDWQQLQILRRLALDLHLGVEVVGMPIIREPDGLAMSSRNAYLSPSERSRALALSRGLAKARARWAAGERAAAPLQEAVRAELVAAEVREDYVALVTPDTLEDLQRADRADARLLVAGFVGKTRLIDNTAIGC